MDNISSVRPFWQRTTTQLLGILLLAFALRVYHIGQQNLWHDEFLTVSIAPMPWEQMFEKLQTLENSKPPLYYFFMHHWLKGGSSETWVRLPSAVFGTLTCLAVYFLGREFGGEKLGILSTLVLAVLPFHIYYSQEARMYALWGLLACLSLLFLIRCFKYPSGLNWAVFVLMTALNCYTFTYGIFVLGVAALWTVLYWETTPWHRKLAVLGACLAVLLVFSPWLIIIISNVRTGIGGQEAQSAGSKPLLVLVYSFFSLFYGFSFGLSSSELRLHKSLSLLLEPKGLLTVAALGVAGTLLLYVTWTRRKDFNCMLLLGALAVIILGPYVLSMLSHSITNNARYVFAAVPVLSVVLAELFFIARKLWLLRGLVFAYLILIGVSLFNLYYSASYARDDIKSPAQYLARANPQVTATIVCAPYQTDLFRHYAPGIEAVPFSMEGKTVTDEQRSRLDAILSKPRFALLYIRPEYGDPDRILLQWLSEHYHLDEKHQWTGSQLFLFSK